MCVSVCVDRTWMVLQCFQRQVESQSIIMKQPMNCLTQTLDGLKRLTPSSHDSLTPSRHRKCLSIQWNIQRVWEVWWKPFAEKKKSRLSPLSQWCSINPSTSTSKPLAQVHLLCLWKQRRSNPVFFSGEYMDRLYSMGASRNKINSPREWREEHWKVK